MVTRPSAWRASILAFNAASETRCVSTKSTATAPRDSASRPRAPEPANRSSTRAPGIDCCRMLNHASFTRSPVGRTLRPAGVFRRRPLNSPAMMRSKTRDSRLNRHPPLPVIPLQPERDVQRIREPVFRHRVGPTEADRGQQRLAVVEREPQMIRTNPASADRARVPHAEHGRRIPRSARLEMSHEPLQLLAHLVQRQLDVDPLARREVRGGEKLASDGEERNAKVLETVAADREARRHGVAAVLLEMHADAMESPVEVEACDAPAGAAPQLSIRLPADQERRPAIALDETRRDDTDDARVPGVGAEHDGGVPRIQGLLDDLDRLIEDLLIHFLTTGVDGFELARERGGFLRILGQQQPQAI